jgi:hypothetical protein
VGDVAFDEVSEVAGFITPVPGNNLFCFIYLLKKVKRESESLSVLLFDTISHSIRLGFLIPTKKFPSCWLFIYHILTRLVLEPECLVRYCRQATSAGIFKQSMESRNRLGIGLSYRPGRLFSLAELVHWNRFLGSLKV